MQEESSQKTCISVDLAKEVISLFFIFSWYIVLHLLTIVFLLTGALTLASALLYPKTLGGGAVFSGWVPFNSSVINQFTKDAIKVSICCCFFLFLVKFFIFLVTVFNFLCICRRQSCGLMGLMTRLYYSKLVKQLFLSFNKLVSLVNLRYLHNKQIQYTNKSVKSKY